MHVQQYSQNTEDLSLEMTGLTESITHGDLGILFCTRFRDRKVTHFPLILFRNCFHNAKKMLDINNPQQKTTTTKRES